MKKIDLVKTLQDKKLSYSASLLNFTELYFDLAGKLFKKAYENACSDREGYAIKKLQHWLDEEGSILLLNTMEQLSEDVADKIKGFTDLYGFLLTSSSDNIEKLVDHLFYIPGEFFREFMGEKRALVGKIEEGKNCTVTNKDIIYTVTKKGIFHEIPFFNKWRAN